jgi:enoyl-CoA hydratase/carnithine racemase
VEEVRVERDGPVQILRLNRPAKKNAITSAMYEALAEALEAASADDEIAVSVLLGSPGIFSAGNDIADFLHVASEGHGVGEVLRFVRALATSDRPLLAAVDGLAVGVGATAVMHCDYVLATPGALFRAPFADLGLVPEAGSSLLAPRIMGHPRAFELLVLGRDFDADAALRAGLVNAIVDRAELEPAILAAAHELAAKPRDAVLAARRLLKGDNSELLARIEKEAEVFAERLASREAQAAFAAFMQKGKS